VTDSHRIRELLAAWELERLFVEELGWDRHSQRLEVEVDARRYELRALAEKRGMVAFSATSPDGDLPDHAARRRIERQAARMVHEHIIVYSDVARTTQVWQWVRREPGRPVASREQWYRAGSSGEALVQRLAGLAFTFEEEPSVSIVDVTRRARSAFDVEQLTKQFYDRFKAEHEAFMTFISGLEDGEHLEWYASVMLNRLMFVYFIQKKGFLDGDRDYLRNRLAKTQELAGRDQFLTFYRHFLLRLFHEALGTDSSSRPKDLDALVGHVPYLNGGLFDVHELERAYPNIDIPDTAFERLFDFFDAYQWHLDDRPLRADNEINPDVLGYIFEKYINQKQMGAYYTKEDITEYIARNVVVAEFLRRAQTNDETISPLLSNDPDAYIFPAVRLGGDSAPQVVALGAEDVAERAEWNTAADPTISGENESWREWAGRQEWYRGVNERAAAGLLRTPDDLVTNNLDIRQVAQDAIETCDRPEQLLRYYATLSSLSILDPTCGSGAFLFAALNVLEPLYDACLDRMAAFLDTGAEVESSVADELRAILHRVAHHPNHRYFVLKSVILNNLYGVDIMEEAVEICKLRLFLKLVAEVQELRDLEPLPDIDFNIRAGNALVGYATRDEVDQSLAERIDFEGVGARIEASAADAGRLFNEFRTAQTGVDVPSEQIRSAKRALRDGLERLRVELDAQLAAMYGVDRADNKGVLADWKRSHQPFHWFAEFYDVIASGGFDCVIGNPPYVEYRDVQRTYTLPDGLYETENCKNLFAFAYERSLSLVRDGAWVGLIIPVASLCTDRYRPLQSLWLAGGLTVASSFNDRPSRLFEGIEHARLAIVLHRGRTKTDDRSVFTTGYLKWTAAERPTLFERLMFVDSTEEVSDLGIPKIGRTIEARVLRNVQAQPLRLAHFLRKTGKAPIHYTRKLSHFVQILDFVPEIIDQNGEKRAPSELKELRFDDQSTALAYLAFLNSSLFYWYLSVFSDCRNLNRREVDAAPFDVDLANSATVERLSELATELMADFRKNSEMRAMSYASVGTLTIQCIFPRRSKRVIDEIDRVLAEHYDFTSDELDFIHNFDVKYRVGRSADDEDSGDVSTEVASAAG
jgi:hypothetical protein